MHAVVLRHKGTVAVLGFAPPAPCTQPVLNDIDGFRLLGKDNLNGRKMKVRLKGNVNNVTGEFTK